MSAHAIAQNILEQVKSLPILTGAPKGGDAAWRPAVPIGHTHFTWYGGVDGPNTIANVSLLTTSAAAAAAIEAEEETKATPVAAAAAAAPKAEAKPSESKKGGKKKALVPPPSMELFNELLMVVGRVTSVSRHPNADKLYVETIDVGQQYGGERTIVSGLVPYMTADELNGSLVIVCANLNPHDFRGVVSAGMILASSNADKSAVKLVQPPADSQPGDRVLADGVEFPGPEPAAGIDGRNSPVTQACFPVLKTNENCEATFLGNVLRTTSGVLKGAFPDAPIS